MWIRRWLKSWVQKVKSGLNFSWRQITSTVTQVLILGPIVLKIYINDLENGSGWTPSKSANNKKLWKKGILMGCKIRLRGIFWSSTRGMSCRLRRLTLSTLVGNYLCRGSWRPLKWQTKCILKQKKASTTSGCMKNISARRSRGVICSLLARHK